MCCRPGSTHETSGSLEREEHSPCDTCSGLEEGEVDTRGQGCLMFCSLFSKGAISERGKISPRVKGRDRASGAFAQPLWDSFYQQGWSLISGL